MFTYDHNERHGSRQRKPAIHDARERQWQLEGIPLRPLSPQEKGRMETAKRGRGGKFDPLADPTELTIQLEASAIRMTWSAEEEFRRRVTRCDYTPPDADPVNVRTLCGKPRGT